NMKTFFEGDKKVFAVIGNVGTPTAAKTLPYALEKDFLFFAPFSGAKLLRSEPPARYVFNCRASYEEETAKVIKFLMLFRKVDPRRIAVFAQNDGYGDDGFRGVAKTLKPHGVEEKDILRVGYERNKLDVNDAVKRILEQKQIQVVVMVATYKPAA